MTLCNQSLWSQLSTVEGSAPAKHVQKNDVVILVLGIHKLHHGQMEQIGLANEETYGVYVYI